MSQNGWVFATSMASVTSTERSSVSRLSSFASAMLTSAVDAFEHLHTHSAVVASFASMTSLSVI